MDDISELADCLGNIVECIKADKTSTMAVEKGHNVLYSLHPLMEEFEKSTSCSTQTAKLWLMYMEMVRILQNYIYAERAGVWKLHIEETTHYTYVACLPHYNKIQTFAEK